MTTLTRRDFMGSSALAMGATALAGTSGTAAGVRASGAGDVVTLGKTGLKCSLLGFGTGSVGGRRASNQTRLGQEKFTKLLGHALERGVRFIDVADQYGSHLFVREALRALKFPRDKLYIMTKTRAQTPDVLKADISRFREELNLDYFDCVLMHCMTRRSWPNEMKPVMDTMAEFKAKGTIKAVGVSCHGMDPLQASTAVDWIDIQLARINHVGVKGKMDGTPEEVVPCLKKLHEAGKGVLGMKILGEGTFKTPELKRESIKFVLGLGCVDAFTIGFETPEQIDEICKIIEEVQGKA